MIESTLVTVPDAWVYALEYGEGESDLSEEEATAMHAKLADLAAKGWHPVCPGEEPAYFTWSHGFHGGTADGGDCVEYVFHRNRTAANLAADRHPALLAAYRHYRAGDLARHGHHSRFGSHAAYALREARDLVKMGRKLRTTPDLGFLPESISGYVGEEIEFRLGQYKIKVTIEHDDTGHKPWDDCGHGEVTDWLRRDKRPGELILSSDGGSKRFYDFQGAIAKAKEERWDAEPFGQGTKGERAARAVQADFERMRQWCADLWSYVGVVVTVYKRGIEVASDSVWCIESDATEYLVETANEIIPRALEEAHKTIRQLAA